jgi:hypothetical protein
MAWEDRNGNRYYYRKRRVNGRVVSEYVGNGYAGELAAIFDNQERQQAEGKRRELRKQRQEAAKMDTQAGDVEKMTRAITNACLLLAGYHTHKGQWRKART